MNDSIGGLMTSTLSVGDVRAREHQLADNKNRQHNGSSSSLAAIRARLQHGVFKAFSSNSRAREKRQLIKQQQQQQQQSLLSPPIILIDDYPFDVDNNNNNCSDLDADDDCEFESGSQCIPRPRSQRSTTPKSHSRPAPLLAIGDELIVAGRTVSTSALASLASMTTPTPRLNSQVVMPRQDAPPTPLEQMIMAACNANGNGENGGNSHYEELPMMATTPDSGAKKGASSRLKEVGRQLFRRRSSGGNPIIPAPMYLQVATKRQNFKQGHKLQQLEENLLKPNVGDGDNSKQDNSADTSAFVYYDNFRGNNGNRDNRREDSTDYYYCGSLWSAADGDDRLQLHSILPPTSCHGSKPGVNGNASRMYSNNHGNTAIVEPLSVSEEFDADYEAICEDPIAGGSALHREFALAMEMLNSQRTGVAATTNSSQNEGNMSATEQTTQKSSTPPPVQTKCTAYEQRRKYQSHNQCSSDTDSAAIVDDDGDVDETAAAVLSTSSSSNNSLDEWLAYVALERTILACEAALLARMQLGQNFVDKLVAERAISSNFVSNNQHKDDASQRKALLKHFVSQQTGSPGGGGGGSGAATSADEKLHALCTAFRTELHDYEVPAILTAVYNVFKTLLELNRADSSLISVEIEQTNDKASNRRALRQPMLHLGEGMAAVQLPTFVQSVCALSEAIGDIGAMKLSQLATTFGSIVDMSLPSSGIGKYGAEAIAEYLASERCCFRLLNLAANPSIGDAGARMLLNALQVNKSVKSLNLSGCGLRGDACSIELAHCFGANRTLIDVDLSYTLIGDGGASALGFALKNSASPLSRLRLRRCGLCSNSLTKLVVVLGETRCRLLDIDISGNDMLGNSSLADIFQQLERSHRAVSLTMSNCSGITDLAALNAKNLRFLRKLDLSDCPIIGNAGTYRIIEALRPGNETLVSLNLNACGLSFGAGCDLIHVASSRHVALLEIKLCNNFFDLPGAAWSVVNQELSRNVKVTSSYDNVKLLQVENVLSGTKVNVFVTLPLAAINLLLSPSNQHHNGRHLDLNNHNGNVSASDSTSRHSSGGSS